MTWAYPLGLFMRRIADPAPGKAKMDANNADAARILRAVTGSDEEA